MAYRKECDYMECRSALGSPDVPFLQIHGSISQQVEDDRKNIEYRYLTAHSKSKLAFCNATCFAGWVEDQGRATPYVRRQKSGYFRQSYY